MDMVIGLTFVALLAIACISFGVKSSQNHARPNKSRIKQAVKTTFKFTFIFWVGVFLGLYAIANLISIGNPMGEGSVMYITFGLPLATPFYILIQFTAVMVAKPVPAAAPPSNMP